MRITGFEIIKHNFDSLLLMKWNLSGSNKKAINTIEYPIEISTDRTVRLIFSSYSELNAFNKSTHGSTAIITIIPLKSLLNKFVLACLLNVVIVVCLSVNLFVL